ncbi:MAG TPA: hypothetical protein P5096_01420 [Patescibacteria group bacterium]|nr:hypothetical protein [Patescibacteria group bacterium]
MDALKIKRDDLLNSANATADLAYPEITNEILLGLFEKSTFSETDRVKASNIIFEAMANSQILCDRIDRLLKDKGGEEAFVDNMRRKLGLID